MTTEVAAVEGRGLPRAAVILGVVLAAAALVVAEARFGNGVTWGAVGVVLALLLVSYPEICLALFLTAGTYKSELTALVQVEVDPTVLLGGLLLAGVVVRLLRHGIRPVLPPRQLVLPFVLLLLIMVFSGLQDTVGEYGRQKLARFGLLTGLASFAAYAVLQTPGQLKRFLITAIALGLLMAGLGTVTGEGLRAFGATHIATGRVLGFALLGVLYVLLATRHGLLPRLGLLAAAGALGLGFLYSGSRGSMVALLVSLAAAALVSFSLKRGRRWVAVGLVLLVGAGAVTTLFVPSATETMNRRVTEVLTHSDAVGSVRGRVQRAEDALALLSEHPLVGVGVGGFDLARGQGDAARGDYPHNILLEIGCELGLLGLAAFLMLVIPALRSAIQALGRTRSRAQFAAAAIVLAVASYFIANAMFSGDLNDNRMLFAALGLCAAGPKLVRAEPAESLLRRFPTPDSGVPASRAGARAETKEPRRP